MNSSSSASVSSWRFEDSSTWRSNSPSRTMQLLGELRILVHQFGDRMQRIEQEMRIQLAAQGVELRLVQQGFELDGLHLPIARLAIEGRRVPREHEAGIHRQIDSRDAHRLLQPGLRERPRRFAIAETQVQCRAAKRSSWEISGTSSSDARAEQRRARSSSPNCAAGGTTRTPRRQDPPRQPVHGLGREGTRPRRHVAREIQLRREHARQQQPQSGIGQPARESGSGRGFTRAL